MGRASYFKDLFQDLRYAVRMLTSSPGFTATAIAALALGIGSTTAIFSVVNRVLLQPLPYPNPERIVALGLSSPQGTGYILAVPEYVAMRGATDSLQDVTAYDSSGPGINLTGGDRPEQLRGIHVSADYFRLFGARTVMGRTFIPEEDRPSGPPVVVISNGLWRSHFGSDPNLVGRSIELGVPTVVIGVLDANFTPDPPADVFLPLQADPNSVDQAHYLSGAARLKPGVTLAQANAELKRAAEQFGRKFPKALGPNGSFSAAPLGDLEVSDVRPALMVLLGAVGFVLLIACANVANLLLARATIRRREIAIRAALGAGRGRIVRQLLTESVLLSLAGGAVGLGLGFAGVRALLALSPGDIPRIGDQGAAVSLDARVLAFTFGVALVTGILFGLIPALSASRSDLNSTLKESGARAGTGVSQNKARSLLVVTEMALALALLVGAALLIRTFYALRTVDPGFDPHNVLTLRMSMAGPRFDKTDALAGMVRDAEQRVGSLPGVAAVAATYSVPLEGGFGLGFTIEGRPLQGNSPNTGGAEWDPVSPQFFDVYRIPLHRGRRFTDLDDRAAPGVVIINEAMARKYWPKENAIGQRITIGKGTGPEFEEPPRQIIGILGDVRDARLNRDPQPVMYVPLAQINDGITKLNNSFVPLDWEVRARSQPFALSKQIQDALRVVSGGLPVAHIQTMDQVVVESTARTNFNMLLLSIFAGAALLLAAIGIYGLMAYSVQQRSQEIGIRMALGASGVAVRNMVVRQGMRLALIGVALGLGLALALSRLVADMLYGVTARDPAIFVLVALLSSLVALAATFIPALRATRVHPVTALRYE
ncbi:MAG TPA: ABC transporter permease [Terriglobia bacterium]|nr:ABC transporter permease [Terriglobia bacterium]